MPTNTVFTEARREGGFVVFDPFNGMFSREAGIMAAGSGLVGAGLVVAALLTAGVAAVAALGIDVGTGLLGPVTVGTAAREGDYRVILVEPVANGGTFLVEDPAGVTIGHGNVGVPFIGGGLTFTLADGGTDFAAGDCFVISVTGAVKYVPYDPTATNGAHRAAAILWTGAVDATAADRRAVFNVRGPLKVNIGELEWGAGVTTPAHRRAALAQLAARGILSV